MSFPTKYSYFNDAIPGIVLGMITRYQEIQKCLFSDCDSWVMKIEKILIHFAFILGYATPSRLVWQVLREILTLCCHYIVSYLDEHPVFEGNLRWAVSLLEYVGLAQIWDHVRDGSICMRFNNCESDFLGQLSNIKISVCGVDDPQDDTRPLTVCEKVFNDSPLILLAIGMLTLTLISNAKLSELNHPKAKTNPSLPPTPPAPPPPASTRKHVNFVSTSEQDQNKDEADNTRKNSDPSSPFGSSSDSDISRLPKNASPPNSARGTPASSSSNSKSGAKNCSQQKSKHLLPLAPNKKSQVIHGKCPKCSKHFYKTFPRPWVICCKKSCKFEIPRPKNGAFKINRGDFGRKSEFSKEELVSAHVVLEMFKKVVKCEVCREKLKKILKELVKIKKDK